MRLDVPLDLYRVYCTVVEFGSMSQAAKELFITQPAVSMSIRNLEERLGKALLVRGARGIRPTAEGELLYESLRPALELIAVAEEKYLAAVELETGELRIGVADAAVGRLLTEYISRFSVRRPKVRVKLSAGGSLEAMLKTGLIEIAVTDLPFDGKARPLVSARYVLIAGGAFRRLGGSVMSADALTGCALALPTAGSRPRQVLDSWAAGLGLVLTPVVEADSEGLLVEFARSGLGLAFATEELIRCELDSGEVIEMVLPAQPPEREIGVICANGRELSCAARSFMELIYPDYCAAE